MIVNYGEAAEEQDRLLSSILAGRSHGHQRLERVDVALLHYRINGGLEQSTTTPCSVRLGSKMGCLEHKRC